MRQLILIIFLFFTLPIFGQPGSDTLPADIQTIQTDSLMKKKSENRFNKIDKEQMKRNLDSFLQMQKERKAKEKKQAFIRIGIGIAFLVILVIGLSRRRKKTAK